MPIKHSLLTGADLHEPKGVESASVNTVYQANGSGSGTWSKIKSIVRGPSADGNDNTPVFFTVPVPCTVTRITAVLTGPVTSVEDALVFAVKDSGGSTLTTFSFPVDDSEAGMAVTVATSISLLAGGYLTIAVDGAQSSQPAIIETSFLLELS